MSARRLTRWTTLACAAAFSGVGCTNLQQAGSLVGVNRQAVGKAAVDSVPVPPPMRVAADHPPFLAEPSCESPSFLQEPTCQAPALREPTCAAPYPSEPTCAGGPRRPCGPAPCSGHAPCSCEKHEHVEAPPEAPQPQGCLAFGGGHVSIPLPTLQLPGFYRVPAFRSALIPVAEPTLIGVPTAPVGVTPVAAAERVVETAETVRVLEEVDVVAARDRAVLVEDEVRTLLERAALERMQDRAAQGDDRSAGDDEPQCLCDEDLERLVEMVRDLKAQQRSRTGERAGGQPTPAAPQRSDEIQDLRSQVQETQREIDALLQDLRSRSGATP